jgi:hypothetical protein
MLQQPLRPNWRAYDAGGHLGTQLDTARSAVCYDVWACSFM